MLFLNRSFDKKRLKALLLWFRLNLSEGAALKVVEILQELGFRFATQGAISLGLDDLKTPTSKGGRVFQAQLEVALAHHEHHRGNRTPVELFQHLVDTWHRTSQDLTTEVVQLFHSTERVNPVYMMAFSGARGNISQVRQLVGMRGLMADPRGQIVGFPILSNFREGLTITEYFVSCYGARKGVVDTAIRTADAGYLTRRLADVSHHVVVRTTNCGTYRSIQLKDIKEGKKTILSLANRLVGRVLAEHISFSSSGTNPSGRFGESQVELIGGIQKGKRNDLSLFPLKCTSDYVGKSCAYPSIPELHTVASPEQFPAYAGKKHSIPLGGKGIYAIAEVAAKSNKLVLPRTKYRGKCIPPRGYAKSERNAIITNNDTNGVHFSEGDNQLIKKSEAAYGHSKVSFDMQERSVGGYTKNVVRYSSTAANPSILELCTVANPERFPAYAGKKYSTGLGSWGKQGKLRPKWKAYRNSEITPFLASKLALQCLEIAVRSPLSCSLPWGVCQLCYGWGLSEGRRVTLGEAVGIIAAQSIGEPGTQLTLRTFHTGGVFSGELLNEIRAPFIGTVHFPKPLQGLLLRTPHGQIAFLAKVSGKMKVYSVDLAQKFFPDPPMHRKYSYFARPSGCLPEGYASFYGNAQFFPTKSKSKDALCLPYPFGVRKAQVAVERSTASKPELLPPESVGYPCVCYRAVHTPASQTRAVLLPTESLRVRVSTHRYAHHGVRGWRSRGGVYRPANENKPVQLAENFFLRHYLGTFDLLTSLFLHTLLRIPKVAFYTFPAMFPFEVRKKQAQFNSSFPWLPGLHTITCTASTKMNTCTTEGGNSNIAWISERQSNDTRKKQNSHKFIQSFETRIDSYVSLVRFPTKLMRIPPTSPPTDAPCLPEGYVQGYRKYRAYAIECLPYPVLYIPVLLPCVRRKSVARTRVREAQGLLPWGMHSLLRIPSAYRAIKDSNAGYAVCEAGGSGYAKRLLLCKRASPLTFASQVLGRSCISSYGIAEYAYSYSTPLQCCLQILRLLRKPLHTPASQALNVLCFARTARACEAGVSTIEDNHPTKAQIWLQNAKKGIQFFSSKYIDFLYTNFYVAFGDKINKSFSKSYASFASPCSCYRFPVYAGKKHRYAQHGLATFGMQEVQLQCSSETAQDALRVHFNGGGLVNKSNNKTLRNQNVLKTGSKKKHDQEFIIQPSTVLFIRQKEQVYHNQLLAEFSSSTLLPSESKGKANDQIEMTQQVLSETAGQVWFKEMDYGSRKGAGSGSLGTHFSSQDLGGIWVLAGKPMTNTLTFSDKQLVLVNQPAIFLRTLPSSDSQHTCASSLRTQGRSTGMLGYAQHGASYLPYRSFTKLNSYGLGRMPSADKLFKKSIDKKPVFRKPTIPLLYESDQVTFATDSCSSIATSMEKNYAYPSCKKASCTTSSKIDSNARYPTKGNTDFNIFPGQFLAYGDNIINNIVTTESGQVLYLNSQTITLRKAQTVLIYSQAIVAVFSEEWIKKGTPLMSLSYQKLVTGDIVQGLPKIEQFFEARMLKDGTFWSGSLQAQLNQFFQECKEEKNGSFRMPLAEAVREGFSKIQRVLVEGVQRVYISQGVLIADKHLEVIVRQMTCKGRILYSGDTGFLRNELVSLDKIENVNQVIYGQKALYHPQVRGITDASLESESFLSAASFQETTRVLSRDAIIGKTDLMRGLKERVIVGQLIQAGTGLANNTVYSLI